MGKFVALGPKASFFRDSVLDLSIAKNEVVELNAMQINSKKIRRALQGGHLIFVDKPTKASGKKQATELSIDELKESFEALAQKKDPKKRILKVFTLDQLKALAPAYEVEVESGDTADTLVEALLNSLSAEDDIQEGPEE